MYKEMSYKVSIPTRRRLCLVHHRQHLAAVDSVEPIKAASEQADSGPKQTGSQHHLLG